MLLINAAYREFGGGIHPPVDDIPGRLIGERIGVDAFNYALPYFNTTPERPIISAIDVFPNPTTCGVFLQYTKNGVLPVQVFQLDGKLLLNAEVEFFDNNAYLDLENLPTGVVVIIGRDPNGAIVFQNKVIVK